eukprot:m51a1_g3674 putative C-tail anchored protein, Protein tyrosine phosphatase domain (315) ;mRNA; f:284562-285805
MTGQQDHPALDLKDAYNFRPVRAPTPHGPMRSDLLFRCAMSEAGEGDLREMARVHGIKSVVDMRAPGEAPAGFEDACRSAGIELFRAPMLTDHHILTYALWRLSAADKALTVWYLATRQTERLRRHVRLAMVSFEFGWFYPIIFERELPSLARVFACLASCPLPAVLCCSQGKDRTGLATALALSLCGAPDAAVVDEYELSQAATERSAEGVRRALGTPEAPQGAGDAETERRLLMHCGALGLDYALQARIVARLAGDGTDAAEAEQRLRRAAEEGRAAEAARPRAGACAGAAYVAVAAGVAWAAWAALTALRT